MADFFKALKTPVLGALVFGFTVQSAQADIVIWEDEHMAPGLYQAAKDFKKQTGIGVTIIEHRYTYALEKLRLDGPAGVGPDLVLLPNDQVSSGAEQGMIEPIMLSDEDKADYLPDALRAVTYKKNIYAIPKSIETLGLFYNKDLLEEPFETLEEYYRYSLDRQKNGKYGLIASFDDLYYGMSVLEPFGAYIFGKKDEDEYDIYDIGLNNEGVYNAISYIRKFYDRGAFPSSLLGYYGRHAINDLFTNRKAAACITGVWQIKPFISSGVNFGVSPLPSLPNGKHMSSFLGVRGFAVSKWSKHKSEAIEFAKFINQTEYAIKRFETTYELPPLKSALESAVIQKNEYARAFVIQSKYSYPMPSVPETQAVWQPFSEALRAIYTGKLEIKKGIDTGVENIREVIRDMYRDQDDDFGELYK